MTVKSPLLTFFLVATFFTTAFSQDSAIIVHKIALTFDDAPDAKYTAKVLHILRREHIHGTFFIIGSKIDSFPGPVKKIVRDGNRVGNHSFHHEIFWRLDCSQLLNQEVKTTEKKIFDLTGMHTKYYRPPFGNIEDSCRALLAKNGYIVVRWNIDPNDYKTGEMDPAAIRDYILRGATDNGVILLHCGGGDRSNTVEALPGIIEGLKSRNFRFVFLEEIENLPK
jgi:peptidoglycan-N-acetylglucosamine deacetylase